MEYDLYVKEPNNFATLSLTESFDGFSYFIVDDILYLYGGGESDYAGESRKYMYMYDIHKNTWEKFEDKNIPNEVAEFSNKKAIFICPKCGREKEYRIATIANKGFHCDVCDRTTNKLTKERFIEQIKQAGGNFEILEEIELASKQVKIKCLNCKNE